MLFSVIALPVLVPIAALLQLLFPGILREQWRQYQYVVKVLMTQSTIIFLHWAVLRWVFNQPPWWLADKYLCATLVVVAGIGALWAWLHRNRSEPVNPPASAGTTSGPAVSPLATTVSAATAVRPTSLEYWALGVLTVAGLLWMAWQVYSGAQPWDQMAVVTIAGLAGILHLLVRRSTFKPNSTPSILTTERVVVTCMVLAGMGVGWYTNRMDANHVAGQVTSEWPTYHANMARTGAANPSDPGISNPRLLWTFIPPITKGSVLLDSSPAVVDGQLYIGAAHVVSASYFGLVYCLNVSPNRTGSDGKALPLGERLWTYTCNNSLKPIFSSPTLSAGRLYLGEGFHEDHQCRLFCLDPTNAEHVLWQQETTSHVESEPTTLDGRMYCGAGDDGVFCWELPPEKSDNSAAFAPKMRWHLEKIHVDSSPAVWGKKVFVGTIQGDLYTTFGAVGINADNGDVLWRMQSEIPVVAAPSVAAGRVFFGLGNGKLGQDAEKPVGAVWCFDAESGKRLWELPLTNGVFASPVATDKLVYVACRDSFCYAVKAENGEVAWKKFLNAPLVATPVLAGGKLYVVTTTGVIYCLDAAQGEILWTFDQLKTSEETVYSSPALVDGKLYLSIAGKVHCIGD